MPTTTVLALFKDKRDAEAAIRALKSAHFENARLGLTPPGDAHVEAGRTLVTVVSENDEAETARRILLQEGAFEAAPAESPTLRKAS